MQSKTRIENSFVNKKKYNIKSLEYKRKVIHDSLKKKES